MSLVENIAGEQQKKSLERQVVIKPWGTMRSSIKAQ